MSIRDTTSSGSRALLAGLTALCLVPAACTLSRVYVGTPMPEESVRLVRPGMTKAEVLELLGPPDTMGLRLDGSVFIYRYRDEGEEGLKLSFMRASIKYETTDRLTLRVVVFFDKKGYITGIGRDRQ